MRAPSGADLLIRVGGSASPDDDITWSDTVSYNPLQDDFVSTFASGRYLSFEFSSNGGNGYELQGFDVELAQRGRF